LAFQVVKPAAAHGRALVGKKGAERPVGQSPPAGPLPSGNDPDRGLGDHCALCQPRSHHVEQRRIVCRRAGHDLTGTDDDVELGHRVGLGAVVMARPANPTNRQGPFDGEFEVVGQDLRGQSVLKRCGHHVAPACSGVDDQLLIGHLVDHAQRGHLDEDATGETRTPPATSPYPNGECPAPLAATGTPPFRGEPDGRGDMGDIGDGGRLNHDVWLSRHDVSPVLRDHHPRRRVVEYL
jgi:hypothetical protein